MSAPEPIQVGPLPLPNGGQVTVILTGGDVEVVCDGVEREDVPEELIDKLVEYARDAQ